MDNVERAKAFLRILQTEGHRAARAAHASPELVWWSPGLGEIQDKLDRIAELTGPHYDDSGLALTVTGVTSEGDRVALEAEAVATLRSGARYANRYHWLFVFEKGRIREIREYNDSRHMFDVWGAHLAPILDAQ